MITEELLKTFCLPVAPKGKQYLTNPFRRGDHIYATNGRILVRVDDDININAASYDNLPNLDHLFADFYLPEIGLIALPKLKKLTKCKVCLGDGFRYIEECNECVGMGIFMHGSNEYVCKRCEGEGTIFSLDKTAKKELCMYCELGCSDTKYIKIGESQYNNGYLHKLSQLPNVKVLPAVEVCGNLKFVFDGGIGVISPARF